MFTPEEFHHVGYHNSLSSAAERMLNSVIMASPDAIVITNEQGQAIVWNDAAEKVFGYKRNEIVGKPIWDIQFQSSLEVNKTPEKYASLKNALTLALSTGESPYLNRMAEVEIQSTDGEILTIQTIAYATQTEAGYVLCSVSRDITQIKRMNEQIQAQAKLIDCIHDAVIACNQNFQIIYSNQAAKELYGWNTNDILEKKLDEYVYISNGCVLSSDAVATLKLKGEVEEELIHHGSNGIDLYTETKAITVPGQVGDSYTYLMIIRDITERKKKEQKQKLEELRLQCLMSVIQHNSSSVQQILDSALEEAISLTGSKIGFICRYNEENQEFVLNSWSKEAMQACQVQNKPFIYKLESIGIWGEVVRNRQSLILNNYEKPDPLKRGLPKGHIPLVRLLEIPIFQNERIVGVLAVANKEIDYRDEDAEQLNLFMDDVWKLVEQYQVQEDLNKRIYELEAVRDISRILRQASTTDELTKMFLSEALRITQWGFGSMFLHSEEDDKLLENVALNWPEGINLSFFLMPGGICDRIYFNRHLITSSDSDLTESEVESLSPLMETGFGFIGAPIRGRDKVIGALFLCSLEYKRYDHYDLALVRMLTEIGGNAIIRSQLTEQINDRNSSLNDEITQRQSVQALLAREKEVLKITLLGIRDGVITVDPNGLVTLFNAAAVKITGFSYQEALGNPLSSVFCLLDFGESPSLETIVAAIEKGNLILQSNINYQPPVIVTKNGEKILLSVSASRLEEKDDLIGYVIIFRDITEQVKAEGQTVLSQKLESIGQLAAGIAHEINTPIQYIGDNLVYMERAFTRFCEYISESETIVKESLAETEKKVCSAKLTQLAKHKRLPVYYTDIPISFKETKEGIEKVRKIVQAIREFSHPVEKEKRLADLNQGILTTVTISRNEWKYYADLETDLDVTLPPILCNIDEINQVILNMIVNSAQAIQTKVEKNPGEKGKIRIYTRSEPGKVKCIVEDNGFGIPQEIQNRIFDPFFTTKAIGKGTGQGLSIAHNIIVNNHQGNIYVESQVGEGTRFTIELPIGIEDLNDYE